MHNLFSIKAMTEKQPVFFDQTEKRGKIVKRVVILGIFCLLFLIINFWISLFIKPLFPNTPFALPRAPHYYTKKHIIPKTTLFQNIKNVFWKNNIKEQIESPINMSAFSVERDDASFQSLKNNLPYIETLYPEWMSLWETWVTLLYPDKRDRTIAYIKQSNTNIKILPTINNFDGTTNVRNTGVLDTVLSSWDARNNLIKQIEDFVVKENVNGVSIDFEEVYDKTQPYFVEFLRELTDEFSTKNLEVSVNLPFDNNSFDYKTIGSIVDNVTVMAYDEHWSNGSPGPIASQNRYQSGIQKIIKAIPKNKITLALGNYWYDRATGNNQSVIKTFQEVITTMKESEWIVSFDQASLNPMTEYYDENNLYHQIRYLDAATFFNQIEIAEDAGISNISLWRLWWEDPSLWNLLKSKSIENNEKPTELETFNMGYDIDYEWIGEIYKVIDTPKAWLRTIEYDTGNNIITNEQIKTFPVPYTIGRLGGVQSGVVVLSFDDSPDPKRTPEILSILKQYNVPGLFFIIWDQAQAHPNIIKQIADQGSFIGNHTFTHPDIALISDKRMDVEINSTQRLIESIIGRSSLLFRPPYAEDIEPEIPDQAHPLVHTTNLGYLTVGMNIDPNDRAKPGTDVIVNRIIDKLQNHKWNIVLLHDGGGDRTETLAALPIVITKLRTLWYKFISIADYAGKTKDQLMPPISNNDKMLILWDSIVYGIMNAISRFIYYVFIIGLTIGLLRLVVIARFALHQGKKSKQRKFPNKDYNPKVSVIVPAYNEEKVINKTVRSLFASTYKNFDIIVIDDGSSDNTYDICYEAYHNNPQVKIFKKSNGGKSKAINFGMEQSDAEIIIILDADTIFDKDTIALMIRHFQDPIIWAVAGNAKVGNRTNFITKAQALEYITNQNLDRRAFDVFNAITVVPGAVGARRRDIITQLWWFKSDTLAEDADLTLEVLKWGYKIVYEDRAIALTEAPETIKAFLKQRFRRAFWVLQMTFKHADALGDKNVSPGLRYFVFPNLIIFQIFFPIIAPFIDLVSTLSLLYLTIDFSLSGNEQHLLSAIHILIYYSIFIIIDGIITVIAFKLEEKEDRKLTRMFPIQRFVYRLLMYYINLKALKTAISGYRVGRWKLERKNSVELKE